MYEDTYKIFCEEVLQLTRYPLHRVLDSEVDGLVENKWSSDGSLSLTLRRLRGWTVGGGSLKPEWSGGINIFG